MLHFLSEVAEVDDHLAALKEGCFVAVLIKDCKKFLIIGKVISYNKLTFKLNYWIGSYNKSWRPHLLKIGKKEIPWSDELPLKCIILVGFEFDQNGRLFQEQKKYLKEKYNNSQM